MHLRRHLRSALALAITALALAGCGGGGGRDPGDGGLVGAPNGAGTSTEPGTPAAPTTGTSSNPTSSVVTVPSGPAPSDAPCAGRPGVEIEAVRIPAVRVPPTHVDAERVGDVTIPAIAVPGIFVPEQRVGAQCARIDDAAAGCFGAVRIPPTRIPAVHIPPARIPAFHAPGVDLPAETQSGETQPAVMQRGSRTRAACALKVRPGETRPSVSQLSTSRPSLSRPSLSRPSLTRPSQTIHGHYIPSVYIPSVYVPSVYVPSVYVPSRYLASKTLPEVTSRCVQVLQGRSATDYALCTDVLFAFNRADLRPRARAVLGQVARSLARRFPHRRIEVDGHTDAKGEPAYNRRLSLRRARAVRDALVRLGVSPSRMTVRGFGESRPVAPNTRSDGSDDPAGRRQNRRVVVGAVR